MVQHWEPVVSRVLEAASPSVIVEIGARHGTTTARLLDFAAKSGAVVHSIDPAPSDLFDLDALKSAYGDQFVFHRAMSLEVLPEIERIDAVLIDGDHNWYTVYHELELLSAGTEGQGRDFPLAILHDVDWPYDRRDQYCAPETIPAPYRHPYCRGGVSPDQTSPLPNGGLHAAGYHAIDRSTPRNGVRTAVEDFLSRNEGIAFFDIIGFHGLGLLVSQSRAARNPALRELLEEFQSPAWLREQSRRIEASRIRFLIRLEELAQGGRPKRWARRLREVTRSLRSRL